MSNQSSSPSSGRSEKPQRRVRPHYEGDPTLFTVMRSPKWILALIFALAVAGGFAWLGQWQLENAIRLEVENAVDSETVQPLLEVTAPGEPVKDGVGGGVFSLTGSLVPGDFTIIENRHNGGENGAWVAGHMLVEGDAKEFSHLSVAIGWAPSVAAAERSRNQLNETPELTELFAVEGRYMPTEGPVVARPPLSPQAMLSMVPAQQINSWQPFEGQSFAGYLVLHPESQLDVTQFGLETIDSVAPLPPETINWVSLFYALEWVVFAGFALFFWYRLVRDDWEKRHELKALKAGVGDNISTETNNAS